MGAFEFILYVFDMYSGFCSFCIHSFLTGIISTTFDILVSVDFWALFQICFNAFKVLSPASPIPEYSFTGQFSHLHGGWIYGEGTMYYRDGSVVKGTWNGTTLVSAQ